MPARALETFSCRAGHTLLHPHPACPRCGAPLSVRRVSPLARLLFVTTVHVNPGGAPFRLGIAVTRSGRARTLCRVEGCVRESGHDPVVLERRGGVFVARPLRHSD
jgi:uncharacterized OB-fold protein